MGSPLPHWILGFCPLGGQPTLEVCFDNIPTSSQAKASEDSGAACKCPARRRLVPVSQPHPFPQRFRLHKYMNRSMNTLSAFPPPPTSGLRRVRKGREAPRKILVGTGCPPTTGSSLRDFSGGSQSHSGRMGRQNCLHVCGKVGHRPEEVMDSWNSLRIGTEVQRYLGCFGTGPTASGDLDDTKGKWLERKAVKGSDSLENLLS